MKLKFTYIVLLSVFSLSLYAQQKGRVNRADKEYDKYAYVDAIETYERIVEKGYKSPDILKKIGNSYYFNAKLVEAEKWYGELFTMTQDVEIEYYFRYAQCLKAAGNYAKADEIMAKFNTLNATDSRGKLAVSNTDYRETIKKNSNRYTIKDAGINSEYSDYGPAFFGEKIVFTSARDTGNFAKKKHTWTDQYFTRLYAADILKDDSLANPKKYANELRTKFHESTPVFTKDGKTVYFTRNNFLNGKKGKDGNKVTLLKVYRATYNDGKWTNVMALPFNSDSYQVAHPALSADEKTLYFASDMPGTLGLSDIFKVSINEDGSFGEPVNLGPTVNTEGRETFPFVSAQNELYLASDGHPGLGGLDIFAGKIEEDGSIKRVLNVGEPANSQWDDFAYIINSETKRGFLTSNRPGGLGDDDIYKFLETKELEFEFKHTLEGIIADEELNLIADAKVTLLDDQFNVLKEVTSDSNGKYSFGLIPTGKTYYVRTEKDDFVTQEKSVTIPDASGKTTMDVTMERKACVVRVGDDLANCFKINWIYFDLDKSNIRQDAAVDLAKILDVLIQNPTMKIDVRSHTDSRASHAYNQKLSDKRAKSTIDWLVKNGIDKSRLSGKGYGETQLVNKCADGVNCTEEEHQQNRRSEFIIIEL
jgi:outer membrane protein OmpA-like peptidoglycan-associated protein